jgi:4-carboxymuconolactone decarboxylase
MVLRPRAAFFRDLCAAEIRSADFRLAPTKWEDRRMSDRWEKGLAAYASQFGIPEDEVWDHMCRLVGERMAREAIESAAGAWVDDCLSLRDRSLIVLAALIAQGGVEARMRPHVRWAVAHGATREELEALASLLAVYVGYPKASVGVQVIREELDALGGGDSRAQA